MGYKQPWGGERLRERGGRGDLDTWGEAHRDGRTPHAREREQHAPHAHTQIYMRRRAVHAAATRAGMTARQGGVNTSRTRMDTPTDT